MPKSPSTTKKKATTKTTRKKSTKKVSSSKSVKFISYAIMSTIVLLSVLAFGYYLGYESGSEETMARYEKKISHTNSEISALKNATTYAKKSAYELKSELEKVLKRQRTAAHEYAQKTPPKPPKREIVKVHNSKPKLAIIFDDVSFSWDVKNIKALKIPVTMSFLPPTKTHPDSAKLAAKEPYYMVHLPMEAMRFHAPEPLTLEANDSKSKIHERIKKVKKLFPRVKYINNHTGSRFTSSKVAMMRLVDVLNYEGIEFIDSRTTAKTKAPEVMKYHNKPYIARDVFLDHDGEVAAVKIQIKRAIAKAKKYGKAIAICHPHQNTLKALHESRSLLLKEVELVRIDSY